MNGVHTTVLLQEAVDALAIRPAGRYLDGTFGRGGHSRAILDRLGAVWPFSPLCAPPGGGCSRRYLERCPFFFRPLSFFADGDGFCRGWRR